MGVVYAVFRFFPNKQSLTILARSLSDNKHPRKPLCNRCVEKEGEIESEGEIGSKRNFRVAILGIEEDNYSDDTSWKICKKKPEKRDLHTGHQSHKKGDSQIPATHPSPIRKENLEVKKEENPKSSGTGIDEGDIQDGIIRGEKMRKEREWNAEGDEKQEEKQEEVYRDQYLIRDFHKEKIIEDEYDGYEGDREEKTEFEVLSHDAEKQEICIHEKYPREEEEYPRCEFQQGIKERDFFPTKMAFSSEADIRKNRQKIRNGEYMPAVGTVAPPRPYTTLLGMNPPNQDRCETPENGSEEEEEYEVERIHRKSYKLKVYIYGLMQIWFIWRISPIISWLISSSLMNALRGYFSILV